MNRIANIVNLALFLIGVLVIVVVVNYFGRDDRFRARIDATKTRAYSLSEQTQSLLRDLQGQWTIAVVMDERRADRSIRRQIDEVLGRYTAASPNVRIVRIDPAQPATLLEYEVLLAQLTAVYKDSIAAYDTALDAAMVGLEEARHFAQQQGGRLEQIVSILPAEDSIREPLRESAGALSLLHEQGRQIEQAVASARQPTDSRPLPDFETARSVLAAALSQIALDVDQLAETCNQWSQRTTLDDATRQFIGELRSACTALAQSAAEHADALKRLPPLELSSIGTQLQQGECALIVSPTRAAVIASAQLFPKRNIVQHEDQRVTFDQRFRGEQLISAAIRSLTVEHMPLIVFVHAEEGTLLRPRPNQADLVGVTNLLGSSRFNVIEWMPATQRDRPSPARGQRAVWVIVPPMQRAGIQIGPAEAALITATSELIQSGESVLLSVYPSILPRYGQTDPWATMAAHFGINIKTSSVIYERVQTGIGQYQLRLSQLVNEFSDSHLIGRAVDGQDGRFTLPVPLEENEAISNVERTALALIQPTPDRWLEGQWTTNPEQRSPATVDLPLIDEVPIVIAAERMGEKGTQRMVTVGAGAWMLSYEADLVVSIGGNRMALVYPGNYELMLASAAWLAGMDDLIAASPLSQEIARLRDVTPERRMLWMWITVAGLPGVCAVCGILVWLVRRH